MTMLRALFVSLTLLASGPAFAADQPDIRVEPPNLSGSQHLQDQTAKAVIQNYLESWKTFSAAFEQNRPDLLDRDFVGSAKDKLASAIHQQSSLGMTTRYRDRSHDLQVLFYSPEGLSIELADNVEYDVEILINRKLAAVQQVHARYIVVLTPAELRWRVRVFQANTE
jgi:hypothetical protein